VISFWAAGVFLGIAIILSIIDLRTLQLPNALVAGLGTCGLLYAMSDFGEGLVYALSGAALGYVSLFILAEGVRRLGGKDGLGGGDIKLAGALGTWTGPWAVAPMLTGASITALVIVGLISLSHLGWRRDQRIPFGPFLAGSGFAIWFYSADPFVLGITS
jgi:leader peptidase (prepilin peptidase)/N-methyltransferase